MPNGIAYSWYSRLSTFAPNIQNQNFRERTYLYRPFFRMPSPQVSHILEDVIDERLPLSPMGPRSFDQLLAKGWRVLGYCMLRHNYTVWDRELVRTIPLRIRLDAFAFSKSQRKVMRRHSDLRVDIAPLDITPEKEFLFDRHATRFRAGGPTPMMAFLTPDSARIPVPALEFQVFDGDRLLASSILHIGKDAVSATYCFFDPDEAHRSLGTFTMLLEIDYAKRFGKRFYYHGYCHNAPSQFDYKKRFRQLEAYDWDLGVWSGTQPG
jgi:arginyl-tRNA--protein-N-Asp/Glu arginylyltransferase